MSNLNGLATRKRVKARAKVKLHLKALEGRFAGPAAAESQEDDAQDTNESKLPFRPFPLEALPRIVKDYVAAGAQALRVDPTYLALPALVSLGGLLGNTRCMQLKTSWHEPSVFWGALVAESSTLKSPAQMLAVRPLKTIQKRLWENHAGAIKMHKIDVAEWKADRKNSLSDPPEPPAPERVVVSDITIESLADVLQKNPRGVTLIRDELSGWFGSFGRYAKGGSNDSELARWLEVFRAEEITIDRKTAERPTIVVPQAAVSVLGTIQPRIAQQLFTKQFFGSGLAARILFAMPPRASKKWTEDVIPKLVEMDYFALFDAIHKTTEEERNDRVGWTKMIEFNAAGKKAWVEFYNEWGDRQAESDGERTYALSKLEGYAGRFAMLLAVIDFFSDDCRAEEVSAAHVKRARQLAEWFAYEADRVYSMLTTPEEKADRQRLLTFVASRGGFITARELLRSNAAKYKTAATARAILDALVNDGVGRWELVVHKETGGRPSNVFFLNEEE